MIKVKVSVEKEVSVRYLKAEIGARHWEDAKVNGVEDSEGLIPCRECNYWSPVIDLANGQIVNWDIGKTANVHYKSCDDNKLTFLDDEKRIVFIAENNYVPNILCPEGEGWGDYVIMNIDENGFIDGFSCELNDIEVSSEYMKKWGEADK